MGYVPTTNYGFQKPEKTNSFNVDDLNSALDKIDSTVKTVDDRTKALEDINIESQLNDIKNQSINSVTLDVDTTDNLKVELTKLNGSSISDTIAIPSSEKKLVTTSDVLFNNLVKVTKSGRRITVDITKDFDIEYICPIHDTYVTDTNIPTGGQAIASVKKCKFYFNYNTYVPTRLAIGTAMLYFADNTVYRCNIYINVSTSGDITTAVGPTDFNGPYVSSDLGNMTQLTNENSINLSTGGYKIYTKDGTV